MAHAIPIKPAEKRKPVTPAELGEVSPEEVESLAAAERRRAITPAEIGEVPLELPELADELVGRIYEQFIPEDPTFRALVVEKPPVTLEFVQNWAAEDTEDFINDLQMRGRTEDTELLLEMFGASEEDITEILGPKVTVPEWLTLDFWKEALFRPYAGKDLGTKAYASFVAGMGDVIVTTGGAARWLGYEEAGSILSDIGSKLQRKAPPSTSGEFEFSDMMSPEFYATKVVRTVPFALSLAPLAIGGYYGGAAIAISLGIRGIWAAVIGGFAGGALSRPLESALEAGSTYDDAISRGKSEQEAKEEADEVFRNNMLLAGMDAFQIAIALAPTPKWVPSSLIKQGLVRTARVAGKMVIIGLSEGGEEVYQDMVQRHARDEEWKLDPVSKEVFAIGMAMGVLMGLSGDVIAGLVNNSKGKMSPEIKKEFEVAVSDSKTEGFNTEQSELQALEAISQTKEGEALVQEALREQRAEEAIAKVTAIEPVPTEVAPEPEIVPFEYQDTNQEIIVHKSWEAASVRFDFEGAGDIFRVLTNKFVDSDYLSEKVARIDRLLTKTEGGRIHPDDAIDKAIREDSEKVSQLIELWEKQPVETKWQELARQLNIALLKNDIPLSRELLNQIQPLTNLPFDSDVWRQPVKLPAKPPTKVAPVEPVAPTDILTKLLRAFQIADENARLGRIFLRDNVVPAFNERFGDAPVMNIVQRIEERFLEITEAGWSQRAKEIGLEPVRWSELKTQGPIDPRTGRVEEFSNLYRIPQLAIEAAKPPTAPKAVERVEPVVTEVIGEAGVPVPPEEVLPKGVIGSSKIIKDMGLKEWVRSSRKVFEKMDLFETYKGIQKAEISEGEEKAANTKARNKIAKTVDKERREAIFDAVEAGDVKGLTFEEKRAANFIRKFYDDWANRKGIPLEKRIGKYITHVFEEEMIAELKETGELSSEMAFMLTDKAKKTITDPFLKERLGAVGFIKDPFKAMEAYDAVSLRVFYYEPTLQKVAAIANDIETPQLFRNYFKSYTKRMTGEMSDVDKMTNNTLAEIAKGMDKIPTVGPGTFLKKQFTDMLTKGNPSAVLSHVVISWQYILWIGGKATSAIRNLSQNVLTISEIGPLAWGDAVGRIATKESRDVLSKSLGKRGRKLALVPGMDSDVVTNALDKFRNVSMTLFRGADMVNVDLAVTGGYYEAKKILISANDVLPKEWTDGKKRVSPERLDELILWRADEVMADTQYLYTKMNSMGASRSGLGRVLSMLTTWGLNWADLMVKWVSKRPSSVYLQFEKETGSKLPKKNWSQTNKAWMTYVAILAFAALIREETRLKAWEYTGATSLNYLANLISGEFPGLQLMGAAAKIATGVALGDERQLNEGWRLLQNTLMPGAIRQGLNVAIGKRDWLTLFLYLKDKDFKVQKLADKWKSETDKYPIFKDAEEREVYFKANPLHRSWSDTKIKQEWRKDNPLTEAKLFVINILWTLSTDKARTEVLRLVEEHSLDTSMIRGYEDVWGDDIKKEIDGFKKRIGNLELLEIGKEAKYFQTDEFASEINKQIKAHGKSMVLMVGDEFTKEYIEAKDLWVQYDNADNEGKKFLRNQFPDVEASLYFWGRISAFENPNSAVLVMKMMEKYGILPQGIKAFADDPARWDALQAPLFQLELKWNDLLVEYETLDADGKELMRDDNPKFRDALRQIEAINKGVPQKHVMAYVDYYSLPIEGQEQERFLKENESFYNEVWLAEEMLGNQPIDFDRVMSEEYEKKLAIHDALKTDEEAATYRDKDDAFRLEWRRLQALTVTASEKFEELPANITKGFVGKYIEYYEKPETGHARRRMLLNDNNFAKTMQALGKITDIPTAADVLPIGYDIVREEFKVEFGLLESGEKTREELFFKGGVVTAFQRAYRRAEAYERGVPEKLHTDYIGYYIIPSAGYDNERYLMKHKGLVDAMVSLGEWKPKDFSNVPTVRFEKSLVDYEKLDVGGDRYAYRGNNSWFDEEGVRLGRWKPWGAPRKKAEPKVEGEIGEREEPFEFEKLLDLPGKILFSPLEEDDEEELDKIKSPKEILEWAKTIPFENMMDTMLKNYGLSLDDNPEDYTQAQKDNLTALYRMWQPGGEMHENNRMMIEIGLDYGWLDEVGIPEDLSPEMLDANSKSQLTKLWIDAQESDSPEIIRGKLNRQMRLHWQEAIDYGILKELGISENIDHRDLSDKVGEELLAAVESAYANEMANIVKTRVTPEQNKWFDAWDVPEQERDSWREHLITVASNPLTRGWYLVDTGEIGLSIEHGIEATTIAHEFAHANYFENIPEDMLQYYPTVHAMAQVMSPMYKEAVESYFIPRLGRLPVEGYATAYEKLGDKLPWYLEPFYGNLLFEVPDAPRDGDKAAVAWLAYWVQWRLERIVSTSEGAAFKAMAAKTVIEIWRGARKP